jgi:hypothetical protein
MGLVCAKNASKKFSRLGTFKRKNPKNPPLKEKDLYFIADNDSGL